MAKRDESIQKPRKRSRGGLVALVILLLLASAAGFLYYSACKAPLALDDPQKMAAAEPMGPAERFQFSGADQTATVKLSKGDVWHLILMAVGENFLEAANEELSGYDLQISGCAIDLQQDLLQLNMEVFYKDHRLVARVPCNMEFTGGRMILTPTGLKLGVLPLPVGGLLSRVKMEYDVVLPVLDQVTRVSYEEDFLVLTGTMEQDVRTLVPRDQKLEQAVLFCEELQNIADALETQEGFSEIMAYLEQNPGSVEDLYRDLFTLTEYTVSREYLADREDMIRRFFPDMDLEAAAGKRNELGEEMGAMYVLLERFFSEAVSEYNGKRLILSEGEFLQKDVPFLTTQLGYQLYGDLAALGTENYFLVLVDAHNGFIRKAPPLNEIADETHRFTKDVDFSKTYVLGLVLHSVDGDPYLMYETEYTENDLYHRVVTMTRLTEAEVDELQVTGAFGVWTD